MPRPMTVLPGVVLFEPTVHADARGFFMELFHARRYREEGAIGATDRGERIVQINHSRSSRNALRGLHFQEPDAQGKLVWVMGGAVYDVVVDVRSGSPTFGEWMGVELSAENHKQVWIPEGFAHGFCVLTDIADFLYACTDFYAPASERAVRWNDPAIGVDWPVTDPILSPKDAAAPLLAEAPVLPSY